jgi:hypothetical protein
VTDPPTGPPTHAADPEAVVQVTRSGGFAGVTWHGQVDLAELPGPDRDAWVAALQELLSELSVHEPAPDRYVYRVRRPGTGLDVTVGEHELPDDVRALLDRAVVPPAPD